ncbi:hypothetical protein HK098_008380 [Nowakowskiella sp. JEL0407]|nr:hypothetical protein HK098_008380 [Nowakowskiella sp. JEL0407]
MQKTYFGDFRKDYAVIDVREPENFILSHIPNAINFPHEILVNSTSDYILAHIAQYCRLLQLETSTANIPPIVLPPQLIFHCRLSLIRGPESASRVEKALDDLKRIGRKNKVQKELKYALDYVDELVTLEESKRLTLLRDSEKLWDEVVWNESLANTRVYLLTGGYKAWLKRDGEKSDEDS